MDGAAFPALSLDTVGTYLDRMGVSYDLDRVGATPVIRTGWRFGAGTAALLISVSDASQATTRLEILCATRQRYPEQLASVLALLNHRNRERAFARSVDDDGTVYLEYVGFYPVGTPFPQATFEVLFGGVLVQFEDDYEALEAARLGDN
jgi:hypothetical protein